MPPEARLEGINLLPLLKDGAQRTERTLFFRYTLPARRQRAVRQGDWKYIEPGPGQALKAKAKAKVKNKRNPWPQLYNLADDLGETTNVAAQHPEKVAELAKRLREIRESGRQP